MISPDLLEILCCPETKEDLQLIDSKGVDQINQAIKAGNVKNRAGHKVDEPISGGLLRKDGKFLYPIREDIPIMLIDEAIPMEPFSSLSELKSIPTTNLAGPDSKSSP